MNKVALLRLADKLEGIGPYAKIGPIPRKRFNMRHWGVPEQFVKVTIDGRTVEVGVSDFPCGTAACAAGWAGSDKWFRKRGLYTGENRMTYKNIADSLEAVEKFFDLPNELANQIFIEREKNKTPLQVARNIRKIVANTE